MASILALVAAFLFALAAALQQKGAEPSGAVASEPGLAGSADRSDHVADGDRGTAHGLCVPGRGARSRSAGDHPAAARDDDRVRAPLGYFLTSQHVGRNEIIGAAVIVVGLALFAIFGDPAGGRENAPGSEWAIAIAILGAVCIALLSFGGRGG